MNTKTAKTNVLATWALCAVLIVFLSPLSSYATQVDKIPPNQIPLYVFGDSLYDTGTALYINKGPAANAYPYGETYFKAPAGRFCDGRNIADFIAEYAGLPFPVPYSNPKLTNYLYSVNFADAAAGVLEETRPNTLNMKLQTESFVEMVGKMQQQYGAEETKKLLSRAVLIFNVGGNDYVDLYNQNYKPIAEELIQQRFKDVIGNMTVYITTMYNQGARKFGFNGFAPLGCMPAFLEPADGSCNQLLNRMATTHDDLFKEEMKKLAKQLPKFKYGIYDFYSSMKARLTNGGKYGFKESQSACCGRGPFNGEFTCMAKTNFTVCDNPTEYLWFDAGHPTQTADEQFAREFWGGASNIVVPHNLKSLFKKVQPTLGQKKVQPTSTQQRILI